VKIEPSDSPPEPVRHTGRVPVYLSSFVGRARELAQLQALLGDGGPRLLTLTGPGGAGKTRLAAQAAVAAAGRFEDGLCWVALEGLNDPGQVPQAVIAALGLVESAVPPLELLKTVLSLRQMLLVLDNCEHVLDACAHLAGQLLSAAADLRILATSRERLNIAGERVWPVPGLSVPAADRSGTGRRQPTPDDLAGYDSVRLFVERSEAVLPLFQLTDGSAPSVSHICRTLEGLPLAVELAAARVRVLGVEQIAERLGRRLDLLGGGPRTAPDRHLTLRATFEWSHEQLSDAERVLFRRLGVFQGRFSLSAAEAVADLGPWTGEAGPAARLEAGAVLDLLTGLVEKSLVVVERPQGERTVFRLLDMVRQFATEKLVEAGEGQAGHETHLAYYTALAVAAEPGLKGPEQRLWLQRLELAHDNLRAALGWAIDQARLDATGRFRLQAQRMANALFWFWNAADMLGEGRDWLERSLALFVPRPVEPLVADGLRMAGTFAWLLGDMDGAWQRHEESLALFQELGDELGTAHAVMMLGRVRLYQGQAGPAVELLGQSVASLQRLGALYERGLGLGALSAALAMAGDYDAAYDRAAECRDIFQVVGDPFFLGMALGDLGWAAYHQGRLAAATGHLEEALALRRTINSGWQMAQALIYLAEINRFRGEVATATAYLEEARALAEDLGAVGWLALSTRHLGLLAAAGGRWPEAAAYLMNSLSHSGRLKDEASMVMAVEGLALVAAAAEERALAGLLFGAAEAKRLETGPPRTPAEQADLARLVEKLAPWHSGSRFAEGQAAGRSLSLMEAGRRAEALRWPADRPPATIVPITHRLIILALGPVDVLVDGRRVTAADWGYAKPKELFFYLVAQPPRTKEQIGLDFWPEASPEQLRRNFRATLYHLRQALGQRDWVLFEAGRYAFNRAFDYWYDVEQFESQVGAAQAAAANDPVQAIEALAEATSLYRGDYLAGLALDEWAAGRRESLRQLYLTAQLNRADLLFAAGRYQDAAAVYQALLAQDNLLEKAHRGLMGCYARLGQRGRALRHYQELVTLLAEELGAAPEAESVALFQRLQSGREL
jgi:predicted ATPase/DNA-binding SARP family transcriptional activator